MDGRAPRPGALADVVRSLRCPVCTEAVTLVERAPQVLGCARGHRFDVARQGHVVLVPGGSRLRPDTADMVAARERVLASGAYDGVRSALVASVAEAPGATGPSVPGLVLDCGAGTGAYTAAVLDALPDRTGLALELSVPALRRAARAHHRLAAVGADLTRLLPLVDGAAAVVVAVFAPLPGDEELHRVTTPGGLLVVVTPTPAHLAGLRDRLGLLDVPTGKPERLDARLSEHWEPVGRTTSVVQVRFPRDLAVDVVAMGPNAWHTDERLRTALADLPVEVPDTVAVTVSGYRRRGRSRGA